MKIAVTLASGKLGSAVIQILKQVIGSENVIAIARTPSKAEHLGVKVRKGDYNAKEDFSSALEGVDKLLLISGMDDPSKRIEQHRNIIEAAKQNGVKKVVYTSIVGDEEGTAFQHVVLSNRQTEEDVRQSGLDWVIGRNGIYIEPDLEYIDTYVKEGGIINCAADGKCGYTSRQELGFAYTKMLMNDELNGSTLNLVGTPITQTQLTEYINEVYGTTLTFTNISVEEYTKQRQAVLGNFLGTIIGGIYEGIKKGADDVTSDFERAAGRPHKSTLDLIKKFKQDTE